jgi:hypothetical protein
VDIDHHKDPDDYIMKDAADALPLVRLRMEGSIEEVWTGLMA